MALHFALALAVLLSDTPARSTGNLQQDFDSATKAADSGDCKHALPLFEALEKNPAVKPDSIAAAATSTRKGQCLIALGRAEEGEIAILSGLPRLEKAGEGFRMEVADCYVSLGDVSYSRWNYTEAGHRYKKALALETGKDRLNTLAKLAKATSFDNNSAALDYADEGIGLASGNEKSSDEIQMTFHTLRGRALLNLGQTEQAYRELKAALKLSGGLTLKTTLSEASMRSDLALAALLVGRKDEARRYLAYTGAGRIAESPFANAIWMAPPDCGEQTGLRPDDFAVVEFGIAEDGSVSSAQTIYTRGGPMVAAEFARAVSNWYWQPEAIAKIPAFYKLATRVEVRCSIAGGMAPGVLQPINSRFTKWAWPLLDFKPTSPFDRRDAVDVLLRRLERSEQDENPQRRIAAIGVLTLVDPRTNTQTIASLDQAITLAEDKDIPLEIVNGLKVLRLLATPYATVSGTRARVSRLRDADYQALLEEPEIVQDALAVNTVRLLAPQRDAAMLRQVADDNRLSAHHPLKQVALLALANDAANSGDGEAAQAFFEKTGLTEQQCALIGARPGLKRTGAHANDFPMEAMRYGFEGWVQLEFDITADGRAADARAVIAYPPFVFVDAAMGMTGGIRYESTYRPSGGVACNAHRETIRFNIGH